MRAKSILGCVGVVILLVVVAALAAWALRDDLGRVLSWRAAEPGEAPADPAAVADSAASGEDKLRALFQRGDTAKLSGREVNGLLERRFSGWVPPYLTDPEVRLAGDTIALLGRVATDRLPPNARLDQIRFLLPDTASVRVEGGLSPLEPGRAAFRVRALTLAGIPIPRRYHPVLLEGFGRPDEPGLPPGAFALELPIGVESARVSEGQLVLIPSRRVPDG
ncbi:MAG: hypothetical protein ACREKN_02785 [Longimicrobiaceae bacterium]